MAFSSFQKLKPTTLRGALLVIFVALLGVAYDLITTYTVGGILGGIMFVAIAGFVAMLILAPYLSSNDPLIKDLQQVDNTLLPYLPLLIQLLPVFESAIQTYGPTFAVLLNQLLAEQAQKANIKPLTQAK